MMVIKPNVFKIDVYSTRMQQGVKTIKLNVIRPIQIKVTACVLMVALVIQIPVRRFIIVESQMGRNILQLQRLTHINKPVGLLLAVPLTRVTASQVAKPATIPKQDQQDKI